MTKIILITTMFLFGCFKDTEVPASSNGDTGNSTAASLQRSSESLDRTLVSMNLMVEDMKRMNRNLDAIFKAVTECKTDTECEALSKQYAKEFEESRGE